MIWTSLFCRRFEPLLAPYTENELPPKERDAVARHLAVCPRCREEAAELEKVGETLRSFLPPAPEPAADLWAKIKAEIETAPEAAPQPVLPQRSRPASWRLPAWGFAASGAALAALAVFAALPWISPVAAPVGNETASAPAPSAAAPPANGVTQEKTFALAEAGRSPAASAPEEKPSARAAAATASRPAPKFAGVSDPFVPLAQRRRQAVGMKSSASLPRSRKARSVLAAVRPMPPKTVPVPARTLRPKRENTDIAMIADFAPEETLPGGEATLAMAASAPAPSPSTADSATAARASEAKEMPSDFEPSRADGRTAVALRPTPAASASVAEAMGRVPRQRGLFSY